MRNGDLIAAPFQHSFHSRAGIEVIVHQEHAPMTRGCPTRFTFGGLISLFAIAAYGSNHRLQLHGKGGAPIFARALDPDFAAVCIDQCLGNGQTEAEAAKATCDFALSLLECVKDSVDLFRLNADAGVNDASLDFAGRGVERLDGDSTFLGGKFHAVLDQIPKHLLQPRRVAFDMRPSGLKIKLNVQIFCRDFFPANFQSPLESLVNADGLKAQLQLPLGDAGDVEQVVN